MYLRPIVPTARIGPSRSYLLLPAIREAWDVPFMKAEEFARRKRSTKNAAGRGRRALDFAQHVVGTKPQRRHQIEKGRHTRREHWERSSVCGPSEALYGLVAFRELGSPGFATVGKAQSRRHVGLLCEREGLRPLIYNCSPHSLQHQPCGTVTRLRLTLKMLSAVTRSPSELSRASTRAARSAASRRR